MGPVDKLRAALELHEVGVTLMRQNLRRRHPGGSDEAIDDRLVVWLRRRPGAEHGDAAGRPSTRVLQGSEPSSCATPRLSRRAHHLATLVVERGFDRDRDLVAELADRLSGTPAAASVWMLEAPDRVRDDSSRSSSLPGAGDALRATRCRGCASP